MIVVLVVHASTQAPCVKFPAAPKKNPVSYSQTHLKNKEVRMCMHVSPRPEHDDTEDSRDTEERQGSCIWGAGSLRLCGCFLCGFLKKRNTRAIPEKSRCETARTSNTAK